MKSMNRMEGYKKNYYTGNAFIIIFCFAVTGFDMNVIINRGSQAVLFIKECSHRIQDIVVRLLNHLLRPCRCRLRVHLLVLCLDFLQHFYMQVILLKPYVRIVVRVIVQCVRTIPVLILALVATFIWGLGAAAGTIAIAVSTWAVMARIGGEDIESLTLKPYEAVTAIGARKI